MNISKTVVITGASRGIGRAISLKFAKEGYQIVINSKTSGDLLELLKKEIETIYNVNCISFIGDMGDYNFVSNMLSEVENTFGEIDILINNAGVSHIGLLSDMTSSEWNNIITTNLTSVFNSCNLVIPYMLKRHSGNIINISSIWGNVGASCEVAYSASKGGLNSFTKALAKELAPSEICVNAIACGVIDTEMNNFLSDDERMELINEIPANRLGKPSEVADLAYGIVSSNHGYLTGQIITLDGGLL